MSILFRYGLLLESGETIGPVCWGHVTSVEETVVKPFQGNWAGTGSVVSTGDGEYLLIASGQYMESSNINVTSGYYNLSRDKYKRGFGSATLKYKVAATEAGLTTAEYATYTDQFYCDGWMKLKIEVA